MALAFSATVAASVLVAARGKAILDPTPRERLPDAGTRATGPACASEEEEEVEDVSALQASSRERRSGGAAKHRLLSDYCPASETDPGPSDDGTQLTIEEVEKHSTNDDCWQVIHGNVYDLTDFDEYQWQWQPYCGKDSTDDFEFWHEKYVLEQVESYCLGKLGGWTSASAAPAAAEPSAAPAADPTPAPTPEPGCQDTSNGAVSMTGNDCSLWDDEPSWCDDSSYYDDNDFTAKVMCCACAGGATGSLLSRTVPSHSAITEFLNHGASRSQNGSLLAPSSRGSIGTSRSGTASIGTSTMA